MRNLILLAALATSSNSYCNDFFSEKNLNPFYAEKTAPNIKSVEKKAEVVTAVKPDKRSYIDRMFEEVSKEVGVDPKLVRAVCWTESEHKPWRYNHADHSIYNHAFGLCQVLYTTANAYGVFDRKCRGSFKYVSKKDRDSSACKLFGVRTNIEVAAKYLKSRLKKYRGNVTKAIAAYNTGTYKVCRTGWLYYKGRPFKRCQIGGPANTYYVKRVKRAMRKGR